MRAMTTGCAHTRQNEAQQRIDVAAIHPVREALGQLEIL
jgi:hypothetical protein